MVCWAGQSYQVKLWQWGGLTWSVFFFRKANCEFFVVKPLALASFALKTCVVFKLPKHPVGI